MQLEDPSATRTCPEIEVIREVLSLDGKTIIELGCGGAKVTRQIAAAGAGCKILALEVDEIQHALNMKVTDLPNVEFALAGAQAIPAADSSADICFMFKSLHHVPGEMHAQAFTEIARVLRPGGHAYISEPIFAGDFNEVLRIFHDEQTVRQAAFEATKAAVESGQLELAQEIFFHTPRHFDDFADFERHVIGATHTKHHLSPEQYEQTKAKFAQSMGEKGADFTIPIRVDLLRKPVAG